ncbi:MAG: GxxExxY protein [Caldilineaceae bacterium]
MSTVLYASETYKIVGAAIEVHRTLGSGFLEAIYQEACEIEFLNRQIPFVAQKELPVQYKGHTLNRYYVADFVCYEKIIVEIKALSELTTKEDAQVLNYLKATGLRVGLLFNFGSIGQLERKRFIR